MLRSALYIVALIMVIAWVLGFFVWDLGSLVHVLLLLAVISVLVSLAGGRKENL